MISDSITAKQISDLMLDLFRRVDESVLTVKKACSPEDAALYQKAVAVIAGSIVMDVLEPLYDEHPSLKPPNWDE